MATHGPHACVERDVGRATAATAPISAAADRCSRGASDAAATAPVVIRAAMPGATMRSGADGSLSPISSATAIAMAHAATAGLPITRGAPLSRGRPRRDAAQLTAAMGVNARMPATRPMSRERNIESPDEVNRSDHCLAVGQPATTVERAIATRTITRRVSARWTSTTTLLGSCARYARRLLCWPSTHSTDETSRDHTRTTHSQDRVDRLTAEISPIGAELRNFSDAHGERLQWDGDPAVWAGRAPILFPIIGMLADGRYRLDGEWYAMAKHGIARYAHFTPVLHEADRATLRLEADATTRAAYPFDFRLDLTFALSDDTLTMTAEVSNRDTRAMPASFGFHPAMRWPLPFGQPRADHRIRFDRDEPAPVRRIDAHALLRPESLPTPVVGDTLVLRDDLFVDDALIFDRLQGRRVAYGAATGPSLDVRFDDFPMFALWTKPGPGFSASNRGRAPPTRWVTAATSATSRAS